METGQDKVSCCSRGEERGVVVDVFHSVFVQMWLAKKGETVRERELSCKLKK